MYRKLRFVQFQGGVATLFLFQNFLRIGLSQFDKTLQSGRIDSSACAQQFLAQCALSFSRYLRFFVISRPRLRLGKRTVTHSWQSGRLFAFRARDRFGEVQIRPGPNYFCTFVLFFSEHFWYRWSVLLFRNIFIIFFSTSFYCFKFWNLLFWELILESISWPGNLYPGWIGVADHESDVGFLIFCTFPFCTKTDFLHQNGFWKLSHFHQFFHLIMIGKHWDIETKLFSDIFFLH